jgi:Ser/Thr protein kinase RdoA (MazF antagonist)
MDVAFLNDIVSQFDIQSSNFSYKKIYQGYINDTYLLEQNSEPKYILQGINSGVFKNIAALHENIDLALKRLNAIDYTQVILCKTKEQKHLYIHNNSFWRLMTFIPNSVAYNITSNSKIAYEAGRIVGKFHSLLKDEDLSNYNETIPNLNYLPFRIKEFNNTIENTTNKLLEKANLEIEFAKAHLHDFEAFYKVKLPKRICHNDTKLNNLLFNKSNDGLCLIDLDTLMEGYFHYDFGDLVRTVVSEANEDEKELHKIKFNTQLFVALIDGINSNGSFLSKMEIEFLPISCALMPFMHGLRALTDYLNGNIYYKVNYPEQNLDRCKSLFQFARLAKENHKVIEDIIYSKLKKAT